MSSRWPPLSRSNEPDLKLNMLLTSVLGVDDAAKLVNESVSVKVTGVGRVPGPTSLPLP